MIRATTPKPSFTLDDQTTANEFFYFDDISNMKK